MRKPISTKPDTRLALVHAAIDLFKEKGYNQVSIKDICDAAQVTRNAFYYYFESKDLIFDAIGDYVSYIAKQRFLSSIGRETFYQQSWEFYHCYLQVQVEMGPEIMNHVCISRTMKGHSDFYTYLDDLMTESMKNMIKKGYEAGEFRNDRTPEELLSASYSIIRGVNIQWCFQWGAFDIIEECKRELDVLFMPNPGYELK